MRFKKILSLFMMGVMFSANIPFNVFAEEITNDTTITEDELVSGSALNVSDSDIDFEFNITGQWEGGFNGEIKITNLTDAVIENWQIQMEFPQEITNIWNAAIDSHEGMVYNIRNAGNNNNVNILVGESITFGFSGTYGESITSPSNVKLVQKRTDVNEEAYTIEYSLLSDWGSGYSAQITITNNTDKPFEAWHLSFDFDRNIDSIWNAVIEDHTDNKYYISNADYNSVIPAKGSISLGFNGSDGTSENEPTNYILSASGLDTQETLNVDIGEEEISNADYYLTDIGFAFGDYANSVTQDITLPTVGSCNGSEITWSSSNPNLISNSGKVTRPVSDSEYVTLTATFVDDEGNSVKKEHQLKVIKEFVAVDIKDVTLADLKALNGGNIPYMYVDEGEQHPRWISGKYSNYKVESPEEAIYSLNALKTICGFDNPLDEYIYSNTIKDDTGIAYRLQQTYNEIPVDGAQVVVGTDLNGNITYFIGRHYYIDVDTAYHHNENEILDAISNNDFTSVNKIIYFDGNNFVLSWKLRSDNTTYIISDVNKDILTQYTDDYGISESYHVGDSTVEDTNCISNAQRSDAQNILNLKFTFEVNGNIFPKTQTQRVLHYIKDNDPKRVKLLNISKAFYTPYYNYELFDPTNRIMCINRKQIGMDKNKYYTTYTSTSTEDTKNFDEIGLNVFRNAETTINRFQRWGRAKDDYIMNSRCLYYIIEDHDAFNLAAYIPNREYIGYNYNDKVYNNLEVCAHETTHAVLHKDIFLESTGSTGPIHEGYADIIGCIINENWNFANCRDIGNVKYKENLNDKNYMDGYYTLKDSYFAYDNKKFGIDKYKMSLILSHAAYNMYNGKNGIKLSYDKLGKLWYKSIKMLDRVFKESDDCNSKYDNTVGAFRSDMTAVAIAVCQASNELNFSENEKKLILSCFSDAGLYVDPLVAGIVKCNEQNINNASVILLSNENEDADLFVKNTLSNINGEYYFNVNGNKPYYLLNCQYDGCNPYEKEVLCDKMVNEENILLTMYDTSSNTISGKVISKFSQEELENISIYVYNANTSGGMITFAPIFVTHTGTNGEYRIPNLADGQYTIKCIDERNLKYESVRFAPFSFSIGIAGDIEAVIELGNTYPLYYYQLVYTTSENDSVPAQGVNITWYKLDSSNSEELWYETVTGNDGEYLIPLADGQYIIYADGQYVSTEYINIGEQI